MLLAIQRRPTRQLAARQTANLDLCTEQRDELARDDTRRELSRNPSSRSGRRTARLAFSLGDDGKLATKQRADERSANLKLGSTAQARLHVLESCAS